MDPTNTLLAHYQELAATQVPNLYTAFNVSH